MARRTREIWRQVIGQYERSGKTQEAYAEERGIPVGTLRGWIHRLKREEEEQATSVSAVSGSTRTTYGAVSPEALRFLRKRAKLTAAQLAELLDTAPETISRWENGKADFVRGTWNTVAALAIEAMQGRDETTRRLRAIQELRGGRQHIELTLKAS
jgi:DNA-binding XRE family transcriptional regulator